MTQTLETVTPPAFVDYQRLGSGCATVMNQFAKRETVHAYLLTGARGLGKRTFAKVLASALFCVSAQKPCGACDECKRFWDGNNPDVLSVFSDDGKQIGVDRVREIIQKTSQHAFGSGYRVVLIEPVEKMTQQAQNCLLKSLEEPIVNVVYLLMTHELTATLGTIASRCLRVKMTPWQDDVLRQALQARGYPIADIEAALPRAGGNIGMAIDILDGGNAPSDTQTFVKEALSMLTDAAAVKLSTRLKESRDEADKYVNALEQAVYQAILVRTGRLASETLSDYPPIWQTAAKQAPVAELNALLDAVFETRRLRAGQVNWQSNIDHLMLKLLEEQMKWQQLLA